MCLDVFDGFGVIDDGPQEDVPFFRRLAKIGDKVAQFVDAVVSDCCQVVVWSGANRDDRTVRLALRAAHVDGG